MKRNSDSSTSSNPRNLSAFIAQVMKDAPNQDKEINHKRYKTAPQQSVEGRGKDKKPCGRKSGISISKQLTTVTRNNSFFDRVSLQSKPRCKQELDMFQTPNKPKRDSANPDPNHTPNKLTSILPQRSLIDFDIKSETPRKSISEYIGEISEKSPTYSLQAGRESVGDWIKTAVKTLSPTAEVTEGAPREKKRKRKLVSEGFAEYIKILSPRLANDVHMWYHSLKQGMHLEGVDSREIITARIQSIRLQGLLYNSVCVAVEPIPGNIAANEQFKTDGRLTIVFTHKTVEMLRIKSNSCVKICPPWTLLSVGDRDRPVILCTYFSFLAESPPTQPVPLVPPVPPVPCVSLWRSAQSLGAAPKGSNPSVREECISDSESRVYRYQLMAGLKSQRWDDLSLAGSVAQVSHPVNPRDLSDTQVAEMNLDQHFHTFLRDFAGTYCLVTLPTRVLDEHTSMHLPCQLTGSTVLLKGVKLVSRVNRHTSPQLMAVIHTLSSGTQRFCHCLSGGLSTKLDIVRERALADKPSLSVFTSQAELARELRVSMVGRLLHTQMETPLSMPEGEHCAPPSGCYLFLFGSNSLLFQVYLEPVLYRGLAQGLSEAAGKLLFLGSLFVSSITHRPTRLQGDQYSLLLELENAVFLFGAESVERIRSEFRSVAPCSYPLFQDGYQLWSMVCVRGSIVDVVADSAYVLQVCGACGEGVEEYSQCSEFFCDQCQTSVTDPVDRYNMDLIIECEGVRDTEIMVHLHDETVKKMLPLIGKGKKYDRVELRGREIEMGSCFVREKLTKPSGLTKVYLEESICSLTI